MVFPIIVAADLPLLLLMWILRSLCLLLPALSVVGVKDVMRPLGCRLLISFSPLLYSNISL